MKKSGLADSPLFRPSPALTALETTQSDSKPEVVQSGFPQLDAQPHNRADAQTIKHTNTQLHERTNTQLHERTNTQLHESTDAQTNKRTTEQPSPRFQPAEREITRESFDIYVDQADWIEQLRLRWKKEQGRHFTKGEVMRTLLEEVLASKK